MRIVIEVDGEKVTAIGPDTAPGTVDASAPNVGDPLPGPPPAALLERAKKLGAMSAGAAQFGRGAALAATTRVAESEPRIRPRASRDVKKRARRAR
jgi:hypothetical protein